MKRALKVFTALLLLSVYTLVVVLGGNNDGESITGNQHPAQKSTYSFVSDNWLCPTAHSEQSVNTGTWLGKPSSTSIGNNFSFYLKATGQQYCSYLFQYGLYVKNIPLRLSCPGIIFPFHYFW